MALSLPHESRLVVVVTPINRPTTSLVAWFGAARSRRTHRAQGPWHRSPPSVVSQGPFFFAPHARCGENRQAAGAIGSPVAVNYTALAHIVGRYLDHNLVAGEHANVKRVGVGSRNRNSVVFAMSESEVSFGEFARLFRDKLRCKNALFLDGGNATSFYSPRAGTG